MERTRATTDTKVNLPQLGSKAPFFDAMTTMGPRSLTDYKGKWLVFFSHPGDFTPVCTTEYMAFAQSNDAFKQRNTELLGLSIGDLYSHLAWLESIYLSTGVQIPFPIIADGNGAIASDYGMFSPALSDTSTVRATFIIDPNSTIRLILYYPFNIGRNIMEILRCIDALQYSDTQELLVPANWMPGLPGIIPPPSTFEELKEREQSREGRRCVNWYLCFKEGDDLGT